MTIRIPEADSRDASRHRTACKPTRPACENRLREHLQAPAFCRWACAGKPAKPGGLPQASLRSLRRLAIACVALSLQPAMPRAPVPSSVISHSGGSGPQRRHHPHSSCLPATILNYFSPSTSPHPTLLIPLPLPGWLFHDETLGGGGAASEEEEGRELRRRCAKGRLDRGKWSCVHSLETWRPASLPLCKKGLKVRSKFLCLA